MYLGARILCRFVDRVVWMVGCDVRYVTAHELFEACMNSKTQMHPSSDPVHVVNGKVCCRVNAISSTCYTLSTSAVS